MRCKRVFSIKMATFYGEVLPVFSRAVDDEEDEDEDISEQWCGNFISSAVIWFIILHVLTFLFIRCHDLRSVSIDAHQL